MDRTSEHSDLTDRQQRERDYHAAYAREHADRVEVPVPRDIISPGPRRPWNGHWAAYDELMALGLPGKRVLVPGCGFGDDAIRLALLGAEVHASDLSPELVAIARARAERAGATGVTFDVAPAETTGYPDGFFDAMYFNDILHHVDIPAAVAETRRVVRPGGAVVANELYTHSSLQRVRDSRFVTEVLYPRLTRRIYGTDRPYITEDEHKIDEHELAVLEAILAPGMRHRYFMMLCGRVMSHNSVPAVKFDQALLRVLGGLGRWLAGRVLVVGRVAG